MSTHGDDADEAQTGAFIRALQRIVAIEPREMRSIVWSWLYFFSLLASTFVLRPLRDSMGLNGGADKYPWLFTGTLVAMVVVSPPFALLVTKLPRKRFIPIVYRVSIACLLAFWLALKFLPESFNLAAAYTFFIWFIVFNLFVVSVFRGFMADIWRLDQAKRLFGFIGVGGTLGALAGSKIASLLAKPIGSVNLLFLSIVLLQVAGFSGRPPGRANPAPHQQLGHRATGARASLHCCGARGEVQVEELRRHVRLSPRRLPRGLGVHGHPSRRCEPRGDRVLDHSDCGRVGLRGTHARPQAARAHGWSASECEQRRRRSRSNGDGSVNVVAVRAPASRQARAPIGGSVFCRNWDHSCVF